MLKVKCIMADPGLLEREVNAWLERNPVEVVQMAQSEAIDQDHILMVNLTLLYRED